MKQITRISPAVLTGMNNSIPEYEYKEEIIVGADATRYRNGDAELSCLMDEGTSVSSGATKGQTVVGCYNTPVNGSLFIIGNGSSGTSRSNIVEVSTTTFSIIKDLEVEGASTLQSVTINRNAKINGTLEVNKDLTVVNGVIKGTMQNSSGISYVNAKELENCIAEVDNAFGNYYTKSQIERDYYTAKTINDHFYTREYIDDNFLNNTPKSIELFGDANTDREMPFIDFHHRRHMNDDSTQSSVNFDCRISCKYYNNYNNNRYRDTNVLLVEGSSTTGDDFLFQARGGLKGHYLDISGDYKSRINHLLPQSHNEYDLGSQNHQWKNIWGKIIYADSQWVRSDRNLKKDIEYLDTDQYMDTFLSLKPCSYIYKDDEENQTRFGFIAQDVEESFNLLNEDKQYALYSKSEKTGEYSMNYLELIALNTCMIQNLILENKELKAEIQKIKGNSY